MKRHLLITATCLCLAQYAPAFGDTSLLRGALPADVPEATDDTAQRSAESSAEELSERLGEILNQAIDANLLANGAVAFDETATQPYDPVIVHSPEAAKNIVSCGHGSPLNFEGYESVSRYQDLAFFKEGAHAMDGEGHSVIDLNLMKAYVTIGLNTEVLTALKFEQGPEASALRQLAALMDNQGQPDLAFFRELATCDEDAKFWLAVALLVANEPEGIDLIQNEMNTFRTLPPALRANVTSIIVPALDALDELDVAKRVMADFSSQEISASSRLQFSMALIDISVGEEGAEKAIQRYMAQSEFQADALTALLQHDRPLHPAQKEIVLSEITRIINQAENDRDITVRLKFALKELSAASNYGLILQLADLPVLQKPLAQNQIRHQLAAGLTRDLEGQDALRKMAAVDALVSDKGLLDKLEDRARLYDLGADFTADLGYHALSGRLSEKSGKREKMDHQQAVLAYLEKNYERVFEIADASDDEQVNLLAALAAVRIGNEHKLRGYEQHLTVVPETVLPLIEQDALQGEWLVAERFYEAAGTLSNDQDKLRATRVLALRKAGREQITPASSHDISQAGRILQRAGQALGDMQKESL